jgi:energy-coupling factor transporter ATP-binding protein EcfA2
MTDPGAPVLALTDLSKTFGRRGGAVKAVRGVSLAVGAGEVYGFLGPNGAGKSTTIRMLIGLIAPSAGSVELFGRDLPPIPRCSGGSARWSMAALSTPSSPAAGIWRCWPGPMAAARSGSTPCSIRSASPKTPGAR